MDSEQRSRQWAGPLISQGSEARVFQITFCGRPAVLKERFQKLYRHPTLDAKLTMRRLHQEARSILKARKLGVATPALYAVDAETYSIVSEFIEGTSIKDALLALQPGATQLAAPAQEMARLVGEALAKLHDGGLVHGDLTTSNMLLTRTNPQANAGLEKSLMRSQTKDQYLVLIDFGLSYNSTIAEDKAVDLYVLERALLSLHSTHEGMMDAVLDSYKASSKFWSATLNKLSQVRMRGRKRVMVG